MSEKNKAIGVFDSGVGGLTVFREMMKQMPKERLIFFGDTARVPYGSKSAYEAANYWKDFKQIIEVDNRPEQTLSYAEIPTKTYGDADPELAGLLRRRAELEAELEDLRARKPEMPPAEYDSALETILLEIADLARRIRSKS